MAVNNPYGPGGAGSQGGRNNPYGTGGTRLTPLPKSVAPVAAPKAAAPKSELPPIFSVAQAVLKGLITSNAVGIAVADEAFKQGNRPINEAVKNVNTLWKPKDIFEPGELDKVKFGEDIAKDTWGMKEQMAYLPKWVTDAAVNAVATRLPGAKQLYEAASAQSDRPGQVPIGTNTFWTGLGLDVVTDPLTYGTLGLSIPFRVGATAARSAGTAAKLASGGEVALKLARKNVKAVPEVANQIPVGVSKRYQNQNLQSVRNNIITRDPKAAEVISKAESKLANNVYKTTRVDTARTFGELSKDIIASAIDAGVKGAKNSLTSGGATRFLTDYARRDVTRTGAAVLKVARDSETGGFGVFTGNKVKLGEAATKQEANALLKEIRANGGNATAVVPVATIQGAKQAVEGNDDVITVPTSAGEEIAIERMVPHEADNGKVYVYDGENVTEFSSLQDANDWVRYSEAPAVDTEIAPVISGKSGAYQVRIGESVTRFKTKKEAVAYADAIRTGEAPSPARTTIGGTPLIDTAPAPMTVKETLAAPTPKEASALRKVLEGIDNVAKKASGWRPLVNQSIANQIKQIVGPVQAQLDRFLMKLTSEQLNVIKSFIDRDLSAKEMFSSLEFMGAQGATLARIIGTIPVSTSKGQKTFDEVLKMAKGEFSNISKAVEGVESSVLEAQIVKQLHSRFYERAQQLKTRQVLPAFEPEGQYQAIVAAAGQEIADKVKATGYLTNQNAANNAKFQNILEQISSGSTEVSYQGYDDLIAGLRRGDEVSSNVLDEIINLIDPDGALKTKFTQATAEPASVYLTRILTREGGVDTIYEAERRLALARDPKMLAKHSGLAYDAEVAGLIERGARNNTEDLDNLPLLSTKQEAARAFAEDYSPAVQKDAMDSVGRAMMGDPKEGGTGGMVAYKAGILEEATGQIKVSTLGDKIAATGEAYADGSRAMFTKQIQQSGEAKILNSLMGKLGYRQGQKAKAARQAGEKAIPVTGEAKLAYAIEHMNAARDGMTGMGFRFVRTKNRDDAEFQKAYDAAIQKAKKTKTTPNFSALSGKHIVYLPMGDILNILSRNNHVTALVDGYFPVGKKVNYKTDALDWISLGDAARRVLEMDAAGEVFDLNEIATRILKRGEGRGLPADQDLAKFKDVANELAEALTDPQVVAQLKAVHMDNAAAIVKDFTQQANDYSEQLFDVLDEAWVAMHASNNLSEGSRMQAVRLFFRKFILASDILRLEGGPIAEAMFRASAMLFADGGRVLPAGKVSKGLTDSEKGFYNLLREDELRLFREALTKYYRYSDMPAAPIGREGMPQPKKAAQAKAQEELDMTMELYAKHMDRLAEVEATGDAQLVRAWDKDMRRLQTRLDKARDAAWKNWLPTFHWHPVDGWVATEMFDHARAVQSANQVHAAYAAGKRGLADREMLMADTAPVVPVGRKLTRAEKAKFLKKYRVEQTAAQIKNARSVGEDVAKNVADEIEMGALDGVPDLNGSDIMMTALQNMQSRTQKELAEIKLYNTVATYKTKLPESNVDFNKRYRPLLDENTPVFVVDRLAAKLKLMAQQWSATTRGTSDAMIVMRGQTNMASQLSADFTASLDRLTNAYRNATPADMDAAWTAIRDNLDLADDASPTAQGIAKNLAPFVNSIFRNNATSVLVQNGMDGAALGNALNRFGVNESIGFPSIEDLSGKTPQDLVANLINQLPFGSLPKNYNVGSGEAEQWFAAREKFRQSEMPVPLAISRMFSAIQQLKAEQGIAYDLVAQFGWQNHFKSIDDAIKDGWVQVQAVGSQSIARFLPDAEGGNLFHPVVAESIGRVFREWNATYEGNALHPWLRASMNLLGFIKFNQTQARPGHHVVNILGDGSTAIIATPPSQYGQIPLYLADGGDIATRYTKLTVTADYSKFGQNWDAQLRRLTGSASGMPNAKMPDVAEMQDGFKVTMYRNGKPTTMKLDRDKLAKDLGDRGALVPGFVQGDIMNNVNDIMLTGSSSGQKRSLSKIWSKVAKPGHEIMQGISTGTAAYSNVIRGYTIARVAKSRSWSSYDEMLNAIIKEVNLLHPTVQSLASAEKKWGRLVFTYYTWLRVAHNALWDLAVNRSAAILAIPKVQYNYANMQGFDPANPAEPYEDKNVLPDYMSYSVYGPTEMGPQGPRVNRPPLILLDVLDFWKMWVDPTKSEGQNALALAGQLAGNVVGPAVNLLGQPIAAAISNQRGQASGPRNINEFGEDILSNFGFMNFLTGMGLHTPYRYKREDSVNQLTDADRQRILNNWLWGTRSQDLYRPINIKIGQSQYNARVKQFNQKTQQENIQKVQQFVDGKISEGYSREEIIDMLKQLGVK